MNKKHQFYIKNEDEILNLIFLKCSPSTFPTFLFYFAKTDPFITLLLLFSPSYLKTHHVTYSTFANQGLESNKSVMKRYMYMTN
jgi:hypothetical protein